MTSSGVRSILAVPIAAGSSTRVALNCYALATGKMDDVFVAAVESFADSI